MGCELYSILQEMVKAGYPLNSRVVKDNGFPVDYHIEEPDFSNVEEKIIELAEKDKYFWSFHVCFIPQDNKWKAWVEFHGKDEYDVYGEQTEEPTRMLTICKLWLKMDKRNKECIKKQKM